MTFAWIAVTALVVGLLLLSLYLRSRSDVDGTSQQRSADELLTSEQRTLSVDDIPLYRGDGPLLPPLEGEVLRRGSQAGAYVAVPQEPPAARQHLDTRVRSGPEGTPQRSWADEVEWPEDEREHRASSGGDGPLYRGDGPLLPPQAGDAHDRGSHVQPHAEAPENAPAVGNHDESREDDDRHDSSDSGGGFLAAIFSGMGSRDDD